MTRDQIIAKFPHASADFIDHNSDWAAPPSTHGTIVEAKRFRQSSAPKMNALEAEFLGVLHETFANHGPIRIQAKTYHLANGVRYTPDFTSSPHIDFSAGVFAGFETAWEVKGARANDDAVVKLKVAAHTWPEVVWWLVWKEGGVWKWQRMVA